MSPHAPLAPRSVLDLTLLALVWGASFLAIRFCLDAMGPVWVVVGRCALGALALWSVILLVRAPRPDPRLWSAFLVMGALNNVVPFGLIAWGQLHVATGLAGILNAATAIWGVLIAALLLPDERLTARRLAGVTIGFAGVAAAIGLSALTRVDPRSLGQLAILGAGLSYALAGVWARRRLRGVPPLAAAAAMLTASTLVALPLAWALEGAPPAALAPVPALALGYLGLVATGAAYMLYWRIIGAAGSGNALLVTLLVAPVAIVLGALVRGETLRAQAYLGFALLVLGLSVLDGRLWKALAKARVRG